MPFNPEILGFLSGILGSVSLLPQIHKSYTTKSSKDISIQTICLMYCALLIGIIYGIVINHAAVYVMNGIATILYIILHGVKIRNERSSTYLELENIELTSSSHEKNEDKV
jgi:MtN3 and saliva related transmembrane protein